MTRSSDRPPGGREGFERRAANAVRNVPAPAGSKAGTAYTRFIPREELGKVESWQPGSLDRRATPRDGPAVATQGGLVKAGAAAPAEPTAAEWQARITAARQSGYQDGYRDGLAALESFKASFATQASAQIGALIEALDQQFAALDQRTAQALAQVAASLAQQVLRCELQQRPEVVAAVASEAVNAVMLSARHISVFVHPEDLPLVAAGAEEALRARGGRLLADAALARGDVRITSDVGTVDASLARRWAQAAAALGVDPTWPQPEPDELLPLPPGGRGLG
jgi:flagellar assembly protein FliH